MREIAAEAGLDDGRADALLRRQARTPARDVPGVARGTPVARGDELPTPPRSTGCGPRWRARCRSTTTAGGTGWSRSPCCTQASGDRDRWPTPSATPTASSATTSTDLVEEVGLADRQDARRVAERLIAIADGIAVQAMFDPESWPAERQQGALDASSTRCSTACP